MPASPRVMRVLTPCATVEEFVSRFAPLVDEESIVIVTLQPRRLGSRRPFELVLAGGEVVMRGESEVIEVVPGQHVRLRFLALDGASRDTLDCMLAYAKGAAAPRPRDRKRPPLVRIPDPGDARRMKPLAPGDIARMISLAPTPAPLITTERVVFGGHGAPPPLPDAVPELLLDGTTERAPTTLRLHGALPVPSLPPRVVVHPRSAAPEAVPEPVITERNWVRPPRIAVRPPADTTERRRVTCRVRDVRPDRRDDAWLVILLLGFAFLASVLSGFLAAT